MVVVFHLHILEEWVREGVSPRAVAERLISFMDNSGMDTGILFPIASYVSNDYTHKVVSYEPERLVGFASVVPNPADIAVRGLMRASKT